MSGTGTEALHQPVRPAVVVRYLGGLLGVLGALNAAPVLACLLLGEAFLLPALLPASAGLLLLGLLATRLPAPSAIQFNEALVVVALAFILGALAMSTPFSLAGGDWVDGFFEAVSALTTTGLSTLPDAGQAPRSLLFARAWMQWYGGLGVVVLSLALFMHNGVAWRQLVDTGATGGTLLSTTRAHARRTASAYLLLTLLAMALCWLCMGDAFDALAYALSAVSTGGFAPRPEGVAGLSAPALSVLMLCAWLGAVSLPLWSRTRQRGPLELWRDVELRALVLATLVLSALLAVWWPAGQGGYFAALALAASAQSTTGFSALPVDSLPPPAQLSLIGAMLIGGSVGSTAGGFKLLRLVLILRLAQAVLARLAAPPHAVVALRVGERAVPGPELSRALLLVLLHLALVGLSWLVFTAYGYPPLPALFEVVSACGTVGLSMGLSAPALEPELKGLLCLNMLAGRLEILALLVLLQPGTWRPQRRAGA